MSGAEEERGAAGASSACPLGCAPAPYLVYLSLGANLGDRRASLKRALRLLARIEDTQLVRVSSFYATPPWGEKNQPPFLNACAVLRTRLLPLVLLRAVQRIERALGRVRKEPWGPRMIDIDLLLAEGYTSAARELRLPHPYMQERAFVLVPLSEIAPGLSVRGKRLDEWLDMLPERKSCQKVCRLPDSSK